MVETDKEGADCKNLGTTYTHTHAQTDAHTYPHNQREENNIISNKKTQDPKVDTELIESYP